MSKGVFCKRKGEGAAWWVWGVRRTKILATLGPASTDEDALERLLRAGADSVRLNFSHGSAKDHEAVFGLVRRLEKRVGRPVPIVQDIQGPKIRVGRLPEGSILLAAGEEVRFRVGEVWSEPGVLPITYAHLAEDVLPGARILMDDGYLSARVVEVEDHETVRAVVESGGKLKSNKGVNFPGTRLSIRFPTEKDKQDLRTGQSLGVDYVAASFVRSAADIARVRSELDDDVGTRVIAKVELREAVDNLEEIVRASDGVMVARGDLGVELSPEEVPRVQKTILHMCDLLGIPSITATQMLESMIVHPRPTRAEVADVYNAVLDGTGALMLSGETAVGAHAVEAVAMMARIAQHAEVEMQRAEGHEERRRTVTQGDVPEVVCHAAARAAEELGAKAILALTHGGLTARVIAKYRPSVPVFALTSVERTWHQCGLVWGVTPLMVRRKDKEADALAAVREAVLATGLVGDDDVVVAVSSRAGVRGASNTLRIGELHEFAP